VTENKRSALHALALLYDAFSDGILKFEIFKAIVN